MMKPSPHATVQQGLLQLLEETLHSHQEVYTEPRTSLLETLARIDAPLASRRYPGLDETIAGHAEHARYYLQHTLDFLEGRNDGTFDVGGSWKVQTVDETLWTVLRSSLEETYGRVMTFVSRTEDWTEGNRFAGAMAMVAHSAYHLGAIRQLKDLLLAV